MKIGNLICFHGTKNSSGIKDTRKLFYFLKKKNKSYVTKIGYLEISKPSIEHQLDFFFKNKFDKIFLTPAMIFSGNHVTKDIPQIVKKLKKKYFYKNKLIINYPLIKSKNFINLLKNNLKINFNFLNKKNNGLILVASNTVSPKAKSQLQNLLKILSTKNTFSYKKYFLVSLNTSNFKKELLKLSTSDKKFLVFPIFLFRGRLLNGVNSVIRELNLNHKHKKFKLCSYTNNYKKLANIMF